MIYKSILLHAYQPPYQTKEWVNKITRESYRPIFNFLKKQNHFCIDLHTNYSLIKLLHEYGNDDVIQDIAECIKKGTVRLMNGTCCHPIICKIPEIFLKLQINEDKRLKKIFGIEANSGGFFCPEMAFDLESLNFLKGVGMGWSVLEDVSVLSHLVPFDIIPSHNGFPTPLRSSMWSRMIWAHRLDFNLFSSEFESRFVNGWVRRSNKEDGYVIIAMDFETFGHHIKNLDKIFLYPAIEHWGEDKTLCGIDDLIKKFPLREMKLRPSSWSTNEQDLQYGNFLPLWDNANNHLHKILWKMVRVVENTLLNSFKENDLVNFLDIHTSCPWWWLNDPKKGAPYDPSHAKKLAKRCYEIMSKYGNNKEIDTEFDIIMAL